MKDRNNKFIVSMDQFKSIQDILSTLQQKVNFEALILADKSGQLINRAGGLARNEAVSVAALAAGSFRANQEIATLIGDPEFTHITHEGTGKRLYISCIDSRFFLISVFNQSVALGLVRIIQKQAEKQLLDIFNAEPEQKPQEMKDVIDDEFDDLLDQSLSDVLDF